MCQAHNYIFGRHQWGGNYIIAMVRVLMIMEKSCTIATSHALFYIIFVAINCWYSQSAPLVNGVFSSPHFGI